MRKQPSLRAAGLLLGIGLGGFIDGILFHQILQWHSMLSNLYFPNTLVNVEITIFWDGLFHAFTGLTTVAGLFFLSKALNGQLQNASWAYFIGLLLPGWVYLISWKVREIIYCLGFTTLSNEHP